MEDIINTIHLVISLFIALIIWIDLAKKEYKE